MIKNGTMIAKKNPHLDNSKSSIPPIVLYLTLSLAFPTKYSDEKALLAT